MISFKNYVPSENPFKIIYVDLTHKCNMACTNCFVPNRDIPDMDLSKYSLLLKQLPNPTEIRLCGGEPTLHPELTEFILLTLNFGHRPVLVTNGLRLADLEFAKKIKNTGLKYVYISASGFNDDDIYIHTDNLKCAERKIQAIKNCDQLGFEIGLGCLLMNNVNTHLIAPIVDFATQLNSKIRINFRNIGKIGRHSKINSQYLSMNQMVDLISGSLEFPKNKIVKFTTSPHQIRFPFKKKNTKLIWIKITDWSPEGYLLPDPGSLVRGRITQDYNLASFFEHVKANELGY